MQYDKIGFIGCGNMAGGIMGGLSEAFSKITFLGYDKNSAAITRLKKTLPLEKAKSIAQLGRDCQIIFLCVKPQNLNDVLSETLTAAQDNERILVSILAGVNSTKLTHNSSMNEDFGISGNKPNLKVLRIMPNLNAAVGRSATGGFFAGPFTAKEKKDLGKLMESFGSFIEFTEEDHLHAVTGLAGSGPAFVLSFIQSMVEGGVLSGLTYDQSMKLTLETISGTIKTLEETGDHPGVIRNRITSPGGTTITGLQVLEKSGFNGLIMAVVHAAVRKSKELGRQADG